MDQINNGNMNVTELEVYRVADGQRQKLVTPKAPEPQKENLPWRKTKTCNEQPITKAPGFKSEPAPNDQIHCAVFVLDSTTLEVISSKLVEKIKSFQKMMSQRGIPQILMLTKIDKLCKEVEKDISNVFKSEMVGKHVEKAAEVFGLPRSNVLPVKNYENEDDLDDNINILALLALRRILHFAEDHLHNFLDKNVDLSKEMETLKVEK